MVQKPLFMLFTHSSATQPIDAPFSTMLSVMGHGLTLDLSMAGYLTVIPALLLIASVWMREEIIRPILNFYFGIAAIFMSFCFVLNIGLYPFWNFPLDSTPFVLFFHISSRCLCQHKHLGRFSRFPGHGGMCRLDMVCRENIWKKEKTHLL